jgi:hypothetical protein
MSELPLKSLPPMSLFTLDFAKALNEVLKADTRIPTGVVRYCVFDKGDNTYGYSIEKCHLDIDEELFQQYYLIADGILQANKTFVHAQLVGFDNK